jgi:hypothetical protein
MSSASPLSLPNGYSIFKPLKLNALKGQAKVARGKRESERAPPRVTYPKTLPLTAKPRDSANPICG